jgi:hypothetical protein
MHACMSCHSQLHACYQYMYTLMMSAFHDAYVIYLLYTLMMSALHDAYVIYLLFLRNMILVNFYMCFSAI